MQVCRGDEGAVFQVGRGGGDMGEWSVTRCCRKHVEEDAERQGLDGMRSQKVGRVGRWMLEVGRERMSVDRKLTVCMLLHAVGGLVGTVLYAGFGVFVWARYGMGGLVRLDELSRDSWWWALLGGAAVTVVILVWAVPYQVARAMWRRVNSWSAALRWEVDGVGWDRAESIAAVSGVAVGLLVLWRLAVG